MMAATCVAASTESPVSRPRVVAESCVTEIIDDDDSQQAETLRRIDAYCRASWKNARLDESLWEDSTQDVFVRIFGSLTAPQMRTAITDRDSPERRELNRAIWATSQRRRREVRWQELTEFHDTLRAPCDVWKTTEAELQSVVIASERADLRLSPTQRAIIRSSTEGDTVQEIAQRLNLSPVRVSDEKYKATQKLRQHFAKNEFGSQEIPALRREPNALASGEKTKTRG